MDTATDTATYMATDTAMDMVMDTVTDTAMDTATNSANMATSTADLWMIMADTATLTVTPTTADMLTAPVIASAKDLDSTVTHSAAKAWVVTTTQPVRMERTVASQDVRLDTVPLEDVLLDTGRSVDTDTVVI